MNGGWSISYEIALRWIPLDLTDDKSTLIQIMASCRQATRHYLSQCWPRSLSPYGVTRPQWVNNGSWSKNTIGITSTGITNVCLHMNARLQPTKCRLLSKSQSNVRSKFDHSVSSPWCLISPLEYIGFCSGNHRGSIKCFNPWLHGCLIEWNNSF